MPWAGYEVLMAIGKPPDDPEDFDLEKEDILGESGQCRLTVETFGGKERNKVAAYLPAPVKVAKPPEKPKLDENGDPDGIPF
jgi:hypothetical protein